MTEKIHLMTGSSTVKCGAPMFDGVTPGWDMSTASPDHYEVTCPACRPDLQVEAPADETTCSRCGAELALSLSGRWERGDRPTHSDTCSGPDEAWVHEDHLVEDMVR